MGTLSENLFYQGYYFHTVLSLLTTLNISIKWSPHVQSFACEVDRRGEREAPQRDEQGFVLTWSLCLFIQSSIRWEMHLRHFGSRMLVSKAEPKFSDGTLMSKQEELKCSVDAGLDSIRVVHSAGKQQEAGRDLLYKELHCDWSWCLWSAATKGCMYALEWGSKSL